ncbi:hypothetical protein [Lysinibacillus odysseyi]|uniref:hypothetical protein n=1 Tax=Lysinibacillus odysseyi TaxID=202611 RepID=UPI000B1D333E|nr:hypothetical protein [Lysinibacillus odysseyi]
MNITYINAKKVIASGNYNPTQMATLLDLYVSYNRITIEQYQELMDMMNAQQEQPVE